MKPTRRKQRQHIRPVRAKETPAVSPERNETNKFLTSPDKATDRAEERLRLKGNRKRETRGGGHVKSLLLTSQPHSQPGYIPAQSCPFSSHRRACAPGRHVHGNCTRPPKHWISAAHFQTLTWLLFKLYFPASSLLALSPLLQPSGCRQETCGGRPSYKARVLTRGPVQSQRDTDDGVRSLPCLFSPSAVRDTSWVLSRWL